ncbi:hypothetical protein [Allosalinactinospora lopnorensis]|nr:hypothetical protein [Allosalinactinospora lopnorensis]
MPTFTVTTSDGCQPGLDDIIAFATRSLGSTDEVSVGYSHDLR